MHSNCFFNNDWVESCVDDKRYISLCQHSLTLLIVERDFATCTCNVNVCIQFDSQIFDAFCVSSPIFIIHMVWWRIYGLMMNLLYHCVSSVSRNLHHIMYLMCVREEKLQNYFHFEGTKGLRWIIWIQSYSESTPLFDLYHILLCRIQLSSNIPPIFSSSS